MFFGIIPIHPHHFEAEVMTIAWSRSANKNLALLDNIPDYLRVKLAEVAQKSYAEIYEPITDNATSLQDALEEILALFSNDNQILGHVRFVWMALILAVVVKPTIEHYQPNNSLADETILRMSRWLLKTIEAATSPKMLLIELSNFEQPDVFSSFSEKLASFQILNEAFNVYVNAIKALNKDRSLEALIDILDDCLEGYAIFPGSEGKRDLLNWLLLDVVPATWNLLPPSYIYIVEGLQGKGKTVLNQKRTLEQISSAMRFIIIKNIKESEDLKPQNNIDFDVNTHEEFKLNTKLNSREDNINQQYSLCS
jgi:hypothetical protein